MGKGCCELEVSPDRSCGSPVGTSETGSKRPSPSSGPEATPEWPTWAARWSDCARPWRWRAARPPSFIGCSGTRASTQASTWYGATAETPEQPPPADRPPVGGTEPGGRHSSRSDRRGSRGHRLHRGEPGIPQRSQREGGAHGVHRTGAITARPPRQPGDHRRRSDRCHCSRTADFGQGTRPRGAKDLTSSTKSPPLRGVTSRWVGQVPSLAPMSATQVEAERPGCTLPQHR